MKELIIKLINLYQITPLSSHAYCRFTPTCSEYMKEAINTYGLKKGLKLGLIRLSKCHPGGPYGYDPLKKEGEKNEKVY